MLYLLTFECDDNEAGGVQTTEKGQWSIEQVKGKRRKKKKKEKKKRSEKKI